MISICVVDPFQLFLLGQVNGQVCSGSGEDSRDAGGAGQAGRGAAHSGRPQAGESRAVGGFPVDRARQIQTKTSSYLRNPANNGTEIESLCIVPQNVSQTGLHPPKRNSV